MTDQQRNARVHLAIKQDIHRIKSGVLELQLLNIHDIVPRAKVHVARQCDFEVDRRKIWRQRMAIRIHKVQLQFVRSFIGTGKGNAQGDRALWMGGGQLARVDGVERAEKIQFAVVVSCGVAKDSDLNVHADDMKP